MVSYSFNLKPDLLLIRPKHRAKQLRCELKAKFKVFHLNEESSKLD